MWYSAATASLQRRIAEAVTGRSSMLHSSGAIAMLCCEVVVPPAAPSCSGARRLQWYAGSHIGAAILDPTTEVHLNDLVAEVLVLGSSCICRPSVAALF
nr:hypothetical protein CFP56_22395 [Quercus suber]